MEEPHRTKRPPPRRSSSSIDPSGLLEIPVTSSPEPLEGSEPATTIHHPVPRRQSTTGLFPPASTRHAGTSTGRSRSATMASAWEDDPLAHIDVPRKFGEAAEYWNHYDKLSDKHNQDLIELMGGNLDILLIFAGLFSAINTAFIVLSLPELIQSPEDQMVQLLTLLVQGKTGLSLEEIADQQPYDVSSQSVRVNCFLSSSLACSMLAAHGAVVAKQWVLDYAQDRAGTLESQGRARQRKLNGAKRYRLLHVIEALGVLLELSLILFFVGLIDYLCSYNLLLAIDMLVFFVFGAAVYGWTLLLAWHDPQCPFQTPVSIFMRRATRWLCKKRRWRSFKMPNLRRKPPPPSIRDGLQHLVPSISINMEPALKSPGESTEPPVEDPQDYKPEPPNDEEHVIDNQTACWIVETSEHDEALFATARNIPALRKIDGTRLGVDGAAFERLVSLFQESLATWRASTGPTHSSGIQSSPLETALVYGRALCHSVVGSMSDGRLLTYRSRSLHWPHPRRTMWAKEAKELFLMKICITSTIPHDFCITFKRDTMPRICSTAPIYLAALLKPSVQRNDFHIRGAKIDRLTLIQWLISQALRKPDNCFPRAVGLCAWALGELPMLMCSKRASFNEDLRNAWWDAYTSERDLYPNLIKALDMYHYYSRVSDAAKVTKPPTPQNFMSLICLREYAEIYTALIIAARLIIDVASRHEEKLNNYTMELDTALRQTLRTVQYQGSCSESDAALLAALDDLEGEIVATLASLRSAGIEAMLPRRDGSDGLPGDSGQSGAGEDRLLSAIETSLELPFTLIGSLLHAREGTRYASLAILRDHGSEWFLDPDSNQVIWARFKEAGLVRNLKACLDDEENFELVSGILLILMQSDQWRESISGNNPILPAYHTKALKILTDNPSFRRLEVYLEVYNAAQEYPELSNLVPQISEADMVIQNCILQVIHKDHKTSFFLQPYVPPALEAYVETPRKIEGGAEGAAVDLVSALEGLRRLNADVWWYLSDG